MCKSSERRICHGVPLLYGVSIPVGSSVIYHVYFCVPLVHCVSIFLFPQCTAYPSQCSSGVRRIHHCVLLVYSVSISLFPWCAAYPSQCSNDVRSHWVPLVNGVSTTVFLYTTVYSLCSTHLSLLPGSGSGIIVPEPDPAKNKEANRYNFISYFSPGNSGQCVL